MYEHTEHTAANTELAVGYAERTDPDAELTEPGRDTEHTEPDAEHR